MRGILASMPITCSESGIANDFRAFMREGIAIETLRALECPLADRACDAAEARAAREAGQ